MCNVGTVQGSNPWWPPNMIKLFELNNIEYERAQQFEKDHIHKGEGGAIGGYISVRFNITGVGTLKTIKCSVCDCEMNITDYYSI